jgi:tetratricopeptide (TPR) repeat protein
MIRLAIAFLLVCCMTLATVLDPSFQKLHARENSSASVLVALMGDSRRLFAHEFFAMADAYFHSGFYPTIFDAAKAGNKSDLKEESHEKQAGAEEHEEESSFLGAPKDWMDRFGRNFYPTVHTHLHGGNEREMLPWLKLSADLDPQEIDTYLTASYWLRTSLNKPDEAEQFLRKGLRANPDSYALLLELGRVYFYSRKKPHVARNIFVVAKQKWRKQDAAGDKPDPHAYEEILGEIVRTDREQGNLKQELSGLEELIKVARGKEQLQQEIDELKAKMGAAKP